MAEGRSIPALRVLLFFDGCVGRSYCTEMFVTLTPHPTRLSAIAAVAITAKANCLFVFIYKLVPHCNMDIVLLKSKLVARRLDASILRVGYYLHGLISGISTDHQHAPPEGNSYQPHRESLCPTSRCWSLHRSAETAVQARDCSAAPVQGY